MKPSGTLFLVLTAILFTCYSSSALGNGSVPSGMVTSVEYGNCTTAYEYDAAGQLTRTITQKSGEPPETTVFEYDALFNLTRVARGSGGESPIVEYEYDSLGRVTRITSSVNPSESPYSEPVVISFAYDLSGNITLQRSLYNDSVGYDNPDTASLSLEVDADDPDHIVKRLYEKKLFADQMTTGDMLYYSYDVFGRRTLQYDMAGNMARTWIYEYDAVGRLTARAEGGDPPSQYRYDAEGRLTRYINGLDNDFSADYTYEYDVSGRRTKIASLTTNPDYAGLGILTLNYDVSHGGSALDLISEIGYTTNESLFGDPPVVCDFQYEFDMSGNITKITCNSIDSPEPPLVVTIDPYIPQTSPYTVTQYEYSSDGTYLWSVNAWTLGNLITRTIYSDLRGYEYRPMLKVGISIDPSIAADLDDPIVLYEWDFDYDGVWGSTNLQGSFTIYEYDAIGNLTAQSLPGHGGGIGGMMKMFAYNTTSPTADPNDLIALCEFDEYGNTDVLIEAEKVGGQDDGGALAAKKKIAKKKTAKKKVGCKGELKGDINGDCTVDLKDFGEMALNWLEDKYYEK